MWSEAPAEILCCQPYVVGLLPRRVEIHCAQSCSLLQTIPLPSGLHAASTVHSVCCGHHGLAQALDANVSSSISSQTTTSKPGSGWDDAEKGGENDKRGSDVRTTRSRSDSDNSKKAELSRRIRDSALVFVATDKSVHLLRMLPLQDQVREMLRGSAPLYNEALSVCFASLGPPWCGVPGPVAIGAGITRDALLYTMANVHTQYGFSMFLEGHYSAALVQFGQACQSGHLPLEWVLGMFRQTPLFVSETSRDDLIGKLRALRKREGDRPQLILFKYPEEPPKLAGRSFSDAVGQFLLLYLLGQRKVLLSRVRRTTEDIESASKRVQRSGSADSIDALFSSSGSLPDLLVDELTVLDTILLRAFVLVDTEIDGGKKIDDGSHAPS